MRPILLITALLLSTICLAQSSLSDSKQYSTQTRIYKISTKEANELFVSDMNKMNEKYLHSFFTSYATDSIMPALPDGNYILTRSVKNNLENELITAGDINFKILNNNRDLIILVHRKNGEQIKNAEVEINNRRIRYDEIYQAYRLPQFNRSGLLKIKHNNALFVTHLEKRKRYRDSYYTDNFFVGLYERLIKRPIVYPVKRLIDRFQYGSNKTYFYSQSKHEKRYRSFMAFSKPKYKPNDTVKLKVFALRYDGKPVNRKMLLRITDDYFDIDTIIAEIDPYRKGGFEYSFVLNNKLDLDLDEQYMITLEELSSRKYDISNYDGNLDEDDYALKRKIVARGKFDYEEYELNSVSFTARVAKEEHSRGMENAVYVRATNENEMAILDGRVIVTVKPSWSPNTKYEDSYVFIPDTLWQHDQALEPLGETKIIIPDSIFPAASFDYTIVSEFLNTNNERHSQQLNSSFGHKKENIFFTIKNDSLQIDYKVAGKDANTKAQLISLNENDTIDISPIHLPVTIKVNPFVSRYIVKNDVTSKVYNFYEEKGNVSCNAVRTKDSVIVQLQNPKKLQVHYTIMAGKKIIKKGSGEELLFKTKNSTPKNYFVSLQYVYNNKAYNEEFIVPYHSKLLNIQIEQPKSIYPGQKADINIHVKDAKGKPVANADVTAYAITKKLNPSLPNVPYLGKLYKARKKHPLLEPSEEEEYESTEILNWNRWSTELNLDTAEYYRFLYPEVMYSSSETVRDSITQMAPFVVLNGNVEPIHYLFIDNRPVFFSQANHLKQYSFKVTPGKHSLKLRTHNKLITVDSVWAYKGRKNFYSFNAANSRPNLQIEDIKYERKEGYRLTEQEIKQWEKYMIAVNNYYDNRFTYIEQDSLIYFLEKQTKDNKTILTGPLQNNTATLHVKDYFDRDFDVEGNYTYQIAPELIKQKQLARPLFNKTLSQGSMNYNFKDFVLTKNVIDTLWNNYVEQLIENISVDYPRHEQEKQFPLYIQLIGDKFPPVKNIILFKKDNTDYFEVFNNSTRQLGNKAPGVYKLILLLEDNQYIINENIAVKPGGYNYYSISTNHIQPADKISNTIYRQLRNKITGSNINSNINSNEILKVFNEVYLNPADFTNTLHGKVYDTQGRAIVGASVHIKGTNYGTVTDADGRYTLKVPKNGTIQFSYIGYNTEEISARQGLYDVELSEQSNSLEEVVVVGYGIQKKSMTTAASVSMVENQLVGRAAGLTISGAPGTSTTINIRGISSMTFDSEPLIIIDGIPLTKDMLNNLSAEDIANMEVLKSEIATAIYGSRAAGGVIIIKSKKGSLENKDAFQQMLTSSNSLRTNFKDDAFWQPKLLTNKNGTATFNVEFPDDITNWQTFAIGMANKKRSGHAQSSITAFKAFTGNTAIPQFMVAEDSVNIIGKILNYQMDSIQVNRKFYVDNMLVRDNDISLRNSFIDTFYITNTRIDSVRVKYTALKEAGNFDGEERAIPVYPQGVQETHGIFAALRKDTSFSFHTKSDSSELKIYAETSVLPVLIDEAEKIVRYEYLCNEQLASKLKALLSQKKIYALLKKDFKNEKAIENIISLLQKNKHRSGLWGWWSNSQPEIWISYHAVESLLQAEAEGYKIQMNKNDLAEFLLFNIDAYKGKEKIRSIELLQLLNVNANYKKYIDSVEKYVDKKSLYEQLKVVQLRQAAGLHTDIDKYIALQKQTVFGNIYWGEDAYKFFDNSVQNTILMYRLIKNKYPENKELLERIAYYFLEKRKDGNWRNTYESSLILETILPELLVDGELPKPSELIINDGEEHITKTFPYTLILKNAQNISITKKGTQPVYFTAYQQYHNPAPKKESNNFTVSSTFKSNGNEIATLKAGQPVFLKIDVEVHADADYVMLEIPIPAGCSYNEKSQSWRNNEVHREHFKNKISLFCSSLKKGSYTFEVSLMPRYTGSYHLNPAKAEMMYFPVFYGREWMKKVKIE